ncbi:amine oxidase [Aspergillus affinis]|uniref:amine oxidase n=1 Tax=Aspergillus affinis TaxID=1070780 RepID=UPI0022FE8240|nr:amine oxidase [Aspergillus affinis]KAI9035797.1 amine oxidase [Aspergillus affinis]
MFSFWKQEDRIGGRTWTAKTLGEEIEMGGTWVHWSQPHVYTELHRHEMAGTIERARMYKLENGGRNCLSDITFNPPLSPIRQTAVVQGHINKGAKIHLKLREKLPGWTWTSSGYRTSECFFAFSDHSRTHPSGPSGTWCIGFGYNGKLADKTDSQHIIWQFKESLYSNVTIEAYATHDWMNDPYAKGAWACWGPNSASKFLEKSQRRHGRIVFASADWADGWRGFVDGAIKQGQVAVREVLKLLKEQGVAQSRLYSLFSENWLQLTVG